MPLFAPIFVPARSSRHRTACFALYRALLRSARDIRLPALAAPEGVKDPMRWLIKGQFLRNKNDVSPRLVYTSLSAGYKFLDLFAKAKVDGSPEHTSVIKHVRSRLRNLESWRASQPARGPPPPTFPGFLTRLPPKTSRAGEKPVFTSTILPRPKSAFSGTRKIPRLCATSFGVPFLRLKKPQPVALSNKLRSLNLMAQKRLEMASLIKDELIPEAHSEDAWEKAVRDLARRERGGGRQTSKEEQDLLDGDGRETYAGRLEGVRAGIMQKVERTSVENIARAKAMLEIVKQEKVLAAQEERQASEARNNATE
ncbi:uncharacterized protein DNG_07506 [Cephalotrichum gorgonifer]|uniref:Uncharacterized protein n=1 Tax=Cephalotrichum gorgonifer TaxID=2041049 RepID=A0AAE8N1Q5_9PEZI|nr:uncharacterized protein DNG_07506 [Cephalotrichum gorgonifer]